MKNIDLNKIKFGMIYKFKIINDIWVISCNSEYYENNEIITWSNWIKFIKNNEIIWEFLSFNGDNVSIKTNNGNIFTFNLLDFNNWSILIFKL